MAVFRKRTHTPTPKKKDIPAGLWTKCPQSGEMVYTKDLKPTGTSSRSAVTMTV